MKSVAKPVQLTLNPERGFGVLLLETELMVDLYSQEPVVWKTRRSAATALSLTFWRHSGRVVPVEKHDAGRDELPTYVIDGSVKS